MTQAKPIFIVGLPQVDGESREDLLRRMKDTHDAAGPGMSDYHVIIHPIQGDEMKFQVFYEKDFSETTFENLKKAILEAIPH